MSAKKLHRYSSSEQRLIETALVKATRLVCEVSYQIAPLYYNNAHFSCGRWVRALKQATDNSQFRKMCTLRNRLVKTGTQVYIHCFRINI
jgi:hypothetical protein